METVHHRENGLLPCFEKGLGGFTQQVLLHHIPNSPNVQSSIGSPTQERPASYLTILFKFSTSSPLKTAGTLQRVRSGPSLRGAVQRCTERRHLLPIARPCTSPSKMAHFIMHTTGLKRGNHRQKIPTPMISIALSLLICKGGSNRGFHKEHPPKTRTAFHPLSPDSIHARIFIPPLPTLLYDYRKIAPSMVTAI